MELEPFVDWSQWDWWSVHCSRRAALQPKPFVALVYVDVACWFG